MRNFHCAIAVFEMIKVYNDYSKGAWRPLTVLCGTVDGLQGAVNDLHGAAGTFGCIFTVIGGADVVAAAEGRTEIGRMVVATAMGYFPNGVIVAFHEFHGHFHPLLGEEIENGLSIKGFESCFEFELINACGLRQRGDGVVIAQVLKDGFAYDCKALNIGIG